MDIKILQLISRWAESAKAQFFDKGLRYLTEVNVSLAGACAVDGTLSRAELYEIKRESHGI